MPSDDECSADAISAADSYDDDVTANQMMYGTDQPDTATDPIDPNVQMNLVKDQTEQICQVDPAMGDLAEISACSSDAHLNLRQSQQAPGSDN